MRKQPLSKSVPIQLRTYSGKSNMIENAMFQPNQVTGMTYNSVVLYIS
jgi:hypothetical protein